MRQTTQKRPAKNDGYTASCRTLNTEQREICDRYYSFARTIAKRHTNERWSYAAQEIEGAAIDGLISAAKDFNSSRGVAFSVYAETRIAGRILTFKRMQKPKGFRRSRDGCPTICELPGSIVDHSRPVGYEIETRDHVDYLIRSLLPHQRKIISLIYLRDVSHGRTAVKIKMSLSYVTKQVAMSLRMMRAAT